MAKVENTRYGYVVEFNGGYYMSSSTNGGFKFTTNYRLRRNYSTYAMAQAMANTINERMSEEV